MNKLPAQIQSQSPKWKQYANEFFHSNQEPNKIQDNHSTNQIEHKHGEIITFRKNLKVWKSCRNLGASGAAKRALTMKHPRSS